MNKETFKNKTYRLINVDNVRYEGKDGFKKRTSDYIIDMFEEEYFKDKTILDLACASGAILFHVKDQIKYGSGVDVDNKKLNIGKQIKERHKVENLNFTEDRCESYIAKTNQEYDCIFMLNIIHHLPDPHYVLNKVAELSRDLICIEAPFEGFYLPYERDKKKETTFNSPWSMNHINQFLHSRNYEVVNIKKSENQENFIGPDRFVCIYKKRKNKKFSSLDDLKNIKKGMIVGPGACGKTTLINKLYGHEIEYSDKNNFVVKNKVFNDEGKSLKFGTNIDSFTEKYPIVYLPPNYMSWSWYYAQHLPEVQLQDFENETVPEHLTPMFKPNIKEWIKILKETESTAIVCYIKTYELRNRIQKRLNALEYQNRVQSSEHQFQQHADNLNFSYQNLFHELNANNIDYHIVDMGGG
tara:strand:+ start:342 stop:1577 length:1236 start_codon:yes stop_codon:yes gene_type:complete